jgi:hypothetical protein
LITFQQGVEGVEKLFLRSFFIRKELDVIDQQGVNRTVVASARVRAGAFSC